MNKGAIYEDAITLGFMDLMATYKQPGFAVDIRFSNVNWDEADDPVFIESITYTNN